MGMSQRSSGGYVGEEGRSVMIQEGVEEEEGHNKIFTGQKFTNGEQISYWW